MFPIFLASVKTPEGALKGTRPSWARAKCKAYMGGDVRITPFFSSLSDQQTPHQGRQHKGHDNPPGPLWVAPGATSSGLLHADQICRVDHINPRSPDGFPNQDHGGDPGQDY